MGGHPNRMIGASVRMSLFEEGLLIEGETPGTHKVKGNRDLSYEDRLSELELQSLHYRRLQGGLNVLISI